MKNLKIFTNIVEQEALDQINTLLSQEAFKDCKVRIMPDVHAGKGCVIGFTANLGDKVIPNIVGVDIGCGMLCVKLKDRVIDFAKLDKVIHEYVPYGRNVHESRTDKDTLQELRCFRELREVPWLMKSLGTLGGGNHFIEVDHDSIGDLYLIIHTGSRNLGKQVAEIYQNLAIDLMSGKDELFEQQEKLIEDYKKAGRRTEIQGALRELRKNFKAHNPNIPKDLCYLTGKYREDYLHDMAICQDFARRNREKIAEIIIEKAKLTPCDAFHTIHNYIDMDSNIVRKGAISAKYGEKLLIPINMRDGCIFGVGKGNDDWNCSAPHGAGRIMSRTKARETLKIEDYQDSMIGIYTTSVSSDTIDEAPMAYKPMQEIVDSIEPTVEILDILKPVYNFKASE